MKSEGEKEAHLRRGSRASPRTTILQPLPLPLRVTHHPGYSGRHALLVEKGPVVSTRTGHTFPSADAVFWILG